MVIALLRLVLVLLVDGARPPHPAEDWSLPAGAVLQVGTGATGDDWPGRADPTRPAAARILARIVRADGPSAASAGKEGKALEPTAAAWSPGRRGTAVAAEEESRSVAPGAGKGLLASRGPPAARAA